ncbi:MAG: phosphate ABC transporter ATP-binding protein PstB [Gammaproteobacteria bacterium]|nr:phosphate ABC transporter ATP-binding protein PstB [Pseudomonadota bacterium]MCH9662482.1 phosphate ABC transporter ATP-binding protein PstB [Gammaproteobacteria bacterium]
MKPLDTKKNLSAELLEVQPGNFETLGDSAPVDAKMLTEDLNVYYGAKQALHAVTLGVSQNEVLALIGPSGCGKTTFIRCLNRMNDEVKMCRVEGKISLDGQDINASGIRAEQIRLRVGMVFQRPNPFPVSIYDNIAYGLRIHGVCRNRTEMDERVNFCLEQVGLIDDVRDRLRESALSLSGGQQQRLCIARTIALNPEVILMDEPCSALDPISTSRIEQLIEQLRENFSVVIVTHSMHQAARISDRIAYFHTGYLIEAGKTTDIFSNPMHELTNNYLTGRFG